MFLFILGISSISLHKEKQTNENDCLFVEIMEIKEKTNHLTLEVESRNNSLINNIKSPQRFFIQLKKTSKSRTLNIKDLLFIQNHLKPISKPKNPYDFDYKSYANQKSIFFTSFLSDKDWILYKHTPNITQAINDNLCHYFDCTLKESPSLSKTILLGKKDTLTSELKTTFKTLGLAHLLAISGLHLALIFGIVQLLFIPFRSKTMFIIQQIVSLFVIWFYGSIVGFPVSIVRAALMLSILIIAQLFNKQTNTINTLWGAAFIILLFNPFALYSLSFQYSFLAVLGIVNIQKKLNRFLNPKNKLLNYIVQLFTVSLSAQFYTFPLTLYYFNELQIASIIANVLIVPIMSIYLYLSIAHLLLYNFEFLNQYTAYIIDQFYFFILKTTEWLTQLLFHLNHKIYITGFSIAILYFILISLSFWTKKSRGKILLLTIVLMLIQISMSIINNSSESNNAYIRIYSTYQSSNIEIQLAHYKHLLTSDSLNIPNIVIKNHSFSTIKTGKANSINTCNIKEKGFLFHQSKGLALTTPFLIITDSTLLENVNYTINYSFILISQYHGEIEVILKHLKTDLLIFDESNASYLCKKWIVSCKEHQIPYFYTKEQGSFYLKLDDYEHNSL